MNSEPSHDQAARWAARLDAGPLTRNEAEALTRWLDGDPTHERLLDEMQCLHQKVRMVLPEMVESGRLPATRRTLVSRPVFAWSGALVAVMLVVLWLVRAPDTFATPAAQRQTLTLADGTVVELNARTRIRVRQEENSRFLRLEEGEVFLHVAKDAARPFVVETVVGRVQVIGTQFVVVSDGASAMEVLLVEGSVRAIPVAGTARQLIPGDHLAVGVGRDSLDRFTPAQMSDALAWRQGRIVFNDTPLGEALAKFGHHHGRLITVAPAVQGFTLGGRFDLDDFDGFLRDLAVALPVVVHAGGGGAVRIELREEK